MTAEMQNSGRRVDFSNARSHQLFVDSTLTHEAPPAARFWKEPRGPEGARTSMVAPLFPGMADEATVTQLDALYIALTALTLLHAVSKRGLWAGSAVVALHFVHTALFEHTSLFLGGTHCHATSAILPMVTPCSSINSVLFYVPWTYTSIEAGDQPLPAMPKEAVSLAAVVHVGVDARLERSPSGDLFVYKRQRGEDERIDVQLKAMLA